MKTIYGISVAFFAATTGCSVTSAAKNSAAHAGPGLAEELLAVMLRPSLQLEELGAYVEIDERAISTRHFSAGRIFEIPAKRGARGVEAAVVQLDDRDEKNLVSVRFSFNQKDGECSLIKDFARSHALAPRLKGEPAPGDDLAAKTAFEGKIGGSLVVAIPDEQRTECIDELTVWTNEGSGT